VEILANKYTNIFTAPIERISAQIRPETGGYSRWNPTQNVAPDHADPFEKIATTVDPGIDFPS
jgi:hypothetical protein